MKVILVIVYADIIFMLNVVMDFFIFWIVSKLIKGKVSRIRLIIGSIMAAFLYCILLFIPQIHFLNNYFGALIILIGTVWFIFRPKRGKELILILIFSHLAAFAVGGCSFVLFFCTNMPDYLGSGFTFVLKQFPLKLLLASVAILYLVIKGGTAWIHTHLTKRQNYCDIIIELEGKQAKFTALIDTGHFLYDPLTRLPVIIVEFGEIRTLFPVELQIAFYENLSLSEEQILEVLEGHSFTKRLRMIPFKSLGALESVMLGFLVDHVELMMANGESILIEKAVVGVTTQSLSISKGYHGLINTDLFTTKNGISFT